MARILICDDARFMRLMLSRIITKMGHEVVGEASNGEEAVKLYHQLRPDIITLDVVMPKMDGLNALRKILALDPNAKVLMVTAIGNQTMVLNAMRLGAREYVVKPFRIGEVVRALNKLLTTNTHFR